MNRFISQGLSRHYVQNEFSITHHAPRRFDPPSTHYHQWQQLAARPTLEVAWRPPQTHLHYDRLYYGIYEYLREPPTFGHLTDAQAYLQGLIRSRDLFELRTDEYRLQCHHILWVQEWIKAVPYDTDECSDADTVENS